MSGRSTTTTKLARMGQEANRALAMARESDTTPARSICILAEALGRIAELSRSDSK